MFPHYYSSEWHLGVCLRGHLWCVHALLVMTYTNIKTRSFSIEMVFRFCFNIMPCISPIGILSAGSSTSVSQALRYFQRICCCSFGHTGRIEQLLSSCFRTIPLSIHIQRPPKQQHKAFLPPGEELFVQ